MFRYRLHDTEGDDLGGLQHPVPNLEPGDTVTTEDGRRWRVVRYVPSPEGAPVHRLLEVEPSGLNRHGLMWPKAMSRAG